MRKVNKTRLAEYIEAMSGLKVCLKFMATFFIIYIYIYKTFNSHNLFSIFSKKHLSDLNGSVSLLMQVSLDAMFDVQIKRIHEYKRQLLNILGIIHRYDCIKVNMICFG